MNTGASLQQHSDHRLSPQWLLTGRADPQRNSTVLSSQLGFRTSQSRGQKALTVALGPLLLVWEGGEKPRPQGAGGRERRGKKKGQGSRVEGEVES